MSTLPSRENDAINQVGRRAADLDLGGGRLPLAGDFGLTRPIVSVDTRRPMTRWADGIARALAGGLGRRFGRHNFRSRSLRGGKR